MSHKFKRPVYHIDAGVTKTGTLECYKPKGAWDNPAKRNWIKYEVRARASGHVHRAAAATYVCLSVGDCPRAPQHS